MTRRSHGSNEDSNVWPGSAPEAGVLRWTEHTRVWTSGDYEITNYPPDARFYARRACGHLAVNLGCHMSLAKAQDKCKRDAEWEAQRKLP